MAIKVQGTTVIDDSQGLRITGVSTFTNGPVLVGTATSTGTPNQRLQVNGGASFVGTAYSVGIGTTNPVYVFTVTDTGTPATTGLTNCLADFTTTANSYAQINLRNTSTGTNASSDVIITADNGSDTTNFIDLGINNSGFSVGSWTINGANDGYLYTSDGNLSIGAINASVAKYISFFTGGTLISNERMRVNATGVGIGTTNPTSALTVAGSGTTTTQLTVSGVSTFAGVTTNTSTIFANQLSVAGVATFTGVTTVTGATLFARQLNVSGVSTIANLIISPLGAGTSVGTAGIVTYYGDGSKLSGISAAGGVAISTNTANQNQLLTYAVSTGSTTGLGVTATGLVFNPSTTRLGIGSTNPSFTADVAGDIRVQSTNRMRFGGTSTTTNFFIQYNSTTNSLDFVAG